MIFLCLSAKFTVSKAQGDKFIGKFKARGIKKILWTLEIISRSIYKKVALLCNEELSEKSQLKMKSHVQKSKHQQPKLCMEVQSYLAFKKKKKEEEVLQYSDFSAGILGISSVSYRSYCRG